MPPHRRARSGGCSGKQIDSRQRQQRRCCNPLVAAAVCKGQSASALQNTKTTRSRIHVHPLLGLKRDGRSALGTLWHKVSGHIPIHTVAEANQNMVLLTRMLFCCTFVTCDPNSFKKAARWPQTDFWPPPPPPPPLPSPPNLLHFRPPNHPTKAVVAEGAARMSCEAPEHLQAFRQFSSATLGTRTAALLCHRSTGHVAARRQPATR